jgi:hypothetical protein
VDRWMRSIHLYTGRARHVDSQAGNDANSGLSRDSAFRTLNKAVASLNRPLQTYLSETT